MKNKTAKILIVILIFVLIIFGITRCVKKTMNSLNDQLNEESVPMLYKVAKQDMSEYINSSGTISSDSIVSITSNLVGEKISELYVEAGDTVTSGQMIAKVDTSDLTSDLSELKSLKNKSYNSLKKIYDNAVISRDETVGEAQKEYDEAKDEYDTYLTACEGNASLCDADTEKELLVAKTTAEKALTKTKKECDALVNEAKTDMEETSEYDSKIKELQNKINSSTIYAPASGLITSLKINKGGLIATSEIGVIQNSDEYKVAVSISEASILKIKPGMKATIKVVATGDKKYTGTVTKVNKLPNSDDYDSVGYKAVITIDDKNTDLLIGMTAKCKINLSNDEKKLAVPYDAVHTDGDLKYVYLLKKNETGDYYTLKYTYIKVGQEGNYYTEVLEGLNENDLIYVTTDDIADDTVYSAGVILNTSYYLGGKNA